MRCRARLFNSIAGKKQVIKKALDEYRRFAAAPSETPQSGDANEGGCSETALVVSQSDTLSFVQVWTPNCRAH